MSTHRNRLSLSLLLVTVLGCSAGPGKDESRGQPPVEAGPEHPMVFTLDRTTPLPLLSVTATREEVLRLRQMYSSFFAEMGGPGKGGTLTLRFDKKGSLGIPWNFYLRNYSPPYPVRLMGILPDGTKEVIHEETY